MAADDKQLTNRANQSAVPGSPTLPSNDAGVFIAALERLGYNKKSLISAANLSKAVLDDPDARIPCEVFGAVVARAMQERPMKNFGVRMAAEIPLGSFPLLDYLVVSSDNVGEGIRQLARYFSLVNNPCTLEIVEQDDCARVRVLGGASFATELTVTLMVLYLRKETDGRFQPGYVSFAHVPDDVAEVERILGCHVRAGMKWSGVELTHETLHLPMRRRDSVLRRLLEVQADEIMARLPQGSGLVMDVRRALARRIAGGDTRIDAVARELVTTSRTLQRRLSDAGASYQDLVETARREAAEKYLANLNLSISEIAYLLGYSEPSVFHRAFKRWNRTTPQAFRQQRHAQGAD